MTIFLYALSDVVSAGVSSSRLRVLLPARGLPKSFALQTYDPSPLDQFYRQLQQASYHLLNGRGR